MNNKIYLSKIGCEFRDSFDIGGIFYFEPESSIRNGNSFGMFSIGYMSYINEAAINHGVHIGRYCSIGRKVTLGAPHHDYKGLTTRIDPGEFANLPTFIGNDVWIGDNAVILSGIRIGDGAIIGAGGVVTKDVAPYSIVGGVSTKHIKWRFPEKTRRELLQSAWWRYDKSYVSKLPLSNISACLTAIKVDNPKPVPNSYFRYDGSSVEYIGDLQN